MIMASKLFLIFLSLQEYTSIAFLLPLPLNSLSVQTQLRHRELTLFAVTQENEQVVSINDNEINQSCNGFNKNLNENSVSEKEQVASDKDDEVTKVKRAVAASLLRKDMKAIRPRGKNGSKVTNRATSVGERRVGSATRARSRSGSLAGRIMSCVTSAATVASKAQSQTPIIDKKESVKSMNSTPTKSVISSAIDSIVQKQIDDKQKERIGAPSSGGDFPVYSPHVKPPLPVPDEKSTLVSARLVSTKSQYRCVRVARPSDDKHIADLRVSVFSDFSPELKREFCRRSCEVLNNRRLKGATCLVACEGKRSSLDQIIERDNSNSASIIGSVECSTFEFAGTELGRRRPGGTVLYITEVAVSPDSRRDGAGAMLMEGVDELASLRKVETIYLHVDVLNEAACALYQKAGYEILDVGDPIYKEFTTSLNLHDGATKGRNHHLMCKKVTKDQTWLPTTGLGFVV